MNFGPIGEGPIALVVGLVFLWASGEAFFQRGFGAKRIGGGKITSASNPARYWITVIGFFLVALICFYWAYTHSRYGCAANLSSTPFCPRIGA